MSLDKCFGLWMLDSVRDRLCVRRLLVTTLAVSLAGASSLGCAGLGRVLGFKEQADSRWPLDYGHVDILHAPETVERVNDLLDRRFRRGWSLTAK